MAGVDPAWAGMTGVTTPACAGMTGVTTPACADDRGHDPGVRR